MFPSLNRAEAFWLAVLWLCSEQRERELAAWMAYFEPESEIIHRMSIRESPFLRPLSQRA
jgi:hypothetical protein